MQLFALGSSKPFGEGVASAAGIALSPHEERHFEDGEHKFRPLCGVRGADVYVLSSLYGESCASVNDKLCQLAFFLGAVRDAGADRVTAVIPYLPYARKDRRTKPRDPLTSRYLAQLLEAMGIDAVVTLDVHNIAAFENAFRCRAVHLDSRRLFCERIKGLLDKTPVAIASPDPGGVKRAQLFREMLERMTGREIGFAFLEKRRSGGVVTGDILAGEVDGASVFVIDDMIASGNTMLRAAKSLLARGAGRVYALAAHGLFVGEASRVLTDADLAATLVTDTVPPFRLPADMIGRHVEPVSAAPLFAEAIRRLHEGGSISALLDGTG